MQELIAEKILQYQNAQRFLVKPKIQAVLKHFTPEESNRLFVSIGRGLFHETFMEICDDKRIFSPLKQKQLRILAQRRCITNYSSASINELIVDLENFEASKYTYHLLGI